VPGQYFVPYIVSNVIGVAILSVAIWRPHVARWLIGAIFAYAAVYNTWLGLTKPEEYQGFAALAWLEVYRQFITGFFRENASVILLLIAFGQAVIAATLAIGKKALWIGALGTCVFLLAIAPLGVGSAFPFSLTVSAAAVIVWRRLTGPARGTTSSGS
jgi:hypothetical protein